MATSVEKPPVAEGDLIDICTLQSFLADGLAARHDRLQVDGSLLDYQVEEYAPVLTWELDGGTVDYDIAFEWPDELSEDHITQEKSRIQDTFLRAGLTRHSNLDDVLKNLRMQDDVIIGIDTNVLWDCILTSILLGEIYEEQFPNWILVAVPRLVMAETENAANNTFGGSHPRSGGPVYQGRVGQRALQEVMDIREPDPDRRGLSMITVGEMEQGAEIDRNNWKLDSLIRHQFQTFLDDISFHKGTFFLSQDRVNVMMSGTEGADGLYLQKPDLADFDAGTIPATKLSRLLYELAIQFGRIRIRSVDSAESLLELSIFWSGKQVSDWRDGKIEVRSVQQD